MTSLLLGLACTDAPEDSAVELPELGELIQVVPSAGIPAQVEVLDSANNLDVVEWQGETWFVFRTAPDHFASDEVHLYVMRSSDKETWELSLPIFMATDLREPRFLAMEDELILHYAVLGTDRLAFEPQGTMRTVFDGSEWSEPTWIFDDGFIPWRTRWMDGEPTMVGYTGGGEIYDQDGYPQLEVKWLTSEDGLDWEGDVVITGGASETDFARLPDGRVIAVARNEAGDADGFGSLICRGEADSDRDWTCNRDLKKYDSPLVFEDAGRIWLVGRRNVTESGHFDLQSEGMDHEDAFRFYSVDYWQHPKRCSLWEVDPDELVVSWVLDLPSAGDTCFASVLGGDGSYEVWNYSSDPDQPDTSWLDGQNGVTRIYRQTLRFGDGD
ncbi:MAG: hypothetical protein GY913_22825 [Proteobacteria bacterium]|nr:hypothetical protein [Pseudomonadota bacterium]